MALFGTTSKLSAVRRLAKDALKGALGGTLGEALDTAKTQVKSRLEARGLIRPSPGESSEATGTYDGRTAGPVGHSPTGGLPPALYKEWQAVGRSLTLQWQLRWNALDTRWRENEARARQSSGGEVLAGEWLAVGEQLLEAWASMGRTLVSGWDALPRFGTWIEMESSLDGALQQAWRSFRPIWGEARSRIYTAMSPKTLTPQAEALRFRLDETLRRGESTLSDAWLSSQGFLQSSVRDCLEGQGVDGQGVDGQGVVGQGVVGQGGAEAVSAGLEAAWAFLLGNLERAWATVMDSLEAALQA